MERKELNLEELQSVAGGSYAFNHNNGKLSVGDETTATIWQITADYDMVANELNAIFNTVGSDAEKNKKANDLIQANGWGTVIKRIG